MDLIAELGRLRLIPVITLHDATHAERLGDTLLTAGLPCAEITLRTPAALDAIRRLRQACPTLRLAAGTVLTGAQADQAMDAGADFVVSPGLNPTTVRHCLQAGIPIIPGINNPSQIEQGLELGLSLLKFFPAEPSGGLPMLKALAAVYPVRFMPTGGISADNLGSWLAQPSVVACGGSWLVTPELLTAGDWTEIRRRITAALALCGR